LAVNMDYFPRLADWMNGDLRAWGQSVTAEGLFRMFEVHGEASLGRAAGAVVAARGGDVPPVIEGYEQAEVT
jgi:hypothetical protein